MQRNLRPVRRGQPARHLPLLAVLAVLAALAVISMLLSPSGLQPQIALAHSDLVSSSPPDGSTLPTSPEELRLRFSAEIDPTQNRLELVTADGDVVAMTSAGADLDDPDRVTLVGVPSAPLEPGDYVVRWMVIDANEPERHELTGEITFSIDPDAPPLASPTPTSAVVVPTSPAQPAPPSANATSDDDGGGMLQIVGAVILTLAVVGGGALLLVRRQG